MDESIMFNLGDRVFCIEPSDGREVIVGKTGTVVHLNGNKPGIAFDEDIGGHTCTNHCDWHHGWYCYNDTLQLIDVLIPPIDVSIEETLGI